ncbi:hypothetical protein ACFX13_043945 [Malus domestica]
MAQKEAFDEQIELDVVGSVKDAQAFTHQQANKDTGVATNVETSREGMMHQMRTMMGREGENGHRGFQSSKTLSRSHDAAENNILCNLFPDDTGLELPHQSAKLLVGDVPAFDEKRISRPYKWAQHLAGIDFLPEVSPLLAAPEASSGDMIGASLCDLNRIQTVVRRIRSRIKAQMALV